MSICKRIFPVTEDREFSTISVFQDWLEKKCKKERNGKFRLWSKVGLGDYNNSTGSLWIFRFQGRLIGEGVVAEDIIDNDDSSPELYAINFQPDSIKIYSNQVYAEDVKLPSGKDIVRRGIILSDEDYEYLKKEIGE